MSDYNNTCRSTSMCISPVLCFLAILEKLPVTKALFLRHSLFFMMTPVHHRGRHLWPTMCDTCVTCMCIVHFKFLVLC